MSYPPKNMMTLVAPGREPWPDIDRLTPDIEVDLAPTSGWYPVVKVVLDYAVALLLMPFALPVILLSAAAVKLTSPGPAFYTQTRLGRHGRTYRIIKIRTMHHNCELRSGIKWAHKHDERVFRFGKFLRATHFDELPQLFNVLLGQMSLVGPRPERPEVIRAKGLENVVPGYRHRLSVKPGVTGLAQLQLPADTDLTSVRHKVVYDLYYVQNQGLLLDLRLLLATALKAFNIGPRVIRRLFRLPTRKTVAAVFKRNLVLTPPPTMSGRLQPA